MSRNRNYRWTPTRQKSIIIISINENFPILVISAFFWSTRNLHFHDFSLITFSYFELHCLIAVADYRPLFSHCGAILSHFRIKLKSQLANSLERYRSNSEVKSFSLTFSKELTHFIWRNPCSKIPSLMLLLTLHFMCASSSIFFLRAVFCLRKNKYEQNDSWARKHYILIRKPRKKLI